jgi:hypothetical protein
MGAFQNSRDLKLVADDQLNTALLQRFKVALKKKFPRGTLSADLRTFTTDEPVPLVDPVKLRYFLLKVPVLLTDKTLVKTLGNYIDMTNAQFNKGEISLKPLRREPPISETAVEVVARDKNLPQDIEGLVKKFGGKSRRKTKKSKSRRRKLTRKH